MTRKDYYRYTKIFLLSLLVSVPVLIVFDLFVGPHLAYWLLMAVNVVILIIGFVVGLVIADKRAQYVARKRQEFLANQQNEIDNKQQQTIDVSQEHKKHK